MYVETQSLSKRYGDRSPRSIDFTFGVRTRRSRRPAGSQRRRQDHALAALDGLSATHARHGAHRRPGLLPPVVSKCTAAFRTCRAKRGCFARCAAATSSISSPRCAATAAARGPWRWPAIASGSICRAAVSTMSTGMRQKLALAVTLAVDTPLVILDEPTSNLDPTVRSDVAALGARSQAGRPHRHLFLARDLRSRASLRPGR